METHVKENVTERLFLSERQDHIHSTVAMQRTNDGLFDAIFIRLFKPYLERSQKQRLFI